MARLLRLCLGVGAFVDAQVRPPRGKAGITPARITVYTSDGRHVLVEQGRRT
jgi:hypothetical protein